VTTTPKTCTCVAKLQVDDCNFAHYLAGSPTAVDGEPMPEDQMRHLLSMTDKLNEKLKVLVSGHKKDDNATAIATMLAFNIQAKEAAQASLKCGYPLVYAPRGPSAPPTCTGAEAAALRPILPTLAGGAVVTAARSSLRCNRVQHFRWCPRRSYSGCSARTATSGGSLRLVRRPGTAASSSAHNERLESRERKLRG
jgi:hypothetical protein